MKMISVKYSGCPYGLDALKAPADAEIEGQVGIFNDLDTAFRSARKHMEDWIRSYEDNRIGVRPIHGYASMMSHDDPTKVEMSASGGWGDSIFMNYRFELANV